MHRKVVKILDNFANIGKAVLTQSLGLQKNYTEVKESTIDVIDYDNNSCKDCKYRSLIANFPEDSEVYQSAVTACQDCPHKIFTQKTVYKKVYHNEKNKYGYKPRLKTNAIKLLLLLHFYHPDKFGIIKDLDQRDLAAQLKCDTKTVRNNLEILKQYSYISYSRIDTYEFNLCLNDYEKYYLPANKGGRGFFVLSQNLLEELLNIRTLLSLRIHLRELMDLDNLNAKGPFTAISKTYRELKRSLPDYCKPGIIRDAIHSSSRIFKIDFKDHSIRFEINDLFDAKKRKDECYQNYIQSFENFMQDFNHTAAYINVNNSEPTDYQTFFPDQSSIAGDHYKMIVLRDYEIQDLAQLALQYSYDLVIEALSSIYKSYILLDKKILNLGGLIRTAITTNLNHSFLAVE